MTSKHEPSRKPYTAGPYLFYRAADGCDEYFYIVDAATQRVLATIFVPWSPSIEKIVEIQANANLFASAPELVQALEALLAGSGTPSQCDAAVKRAAALVAKVHGIDKAEPVDLAEDRKTGSHGSELHSLRGKEDRNRE